MARYRCKWNKTRTVCYRSDGTLCQIKKKPTGVRRLGVSPFFVKFWFPDRSTATSGARTKALAQRKCRSFR